MGYLGNLGTLNFGSGTPIVLNSDLRCGNLHPIGLRCLHFLDEYNIESARLANDDLGCNEVISHLPGCERIAPSRHFDFRPPLRIRRSSVDAQPYIDISNRCACSLFADLDGQAAFWSWNSNARDVQPGITMYTRDLQLVCTGR